MKIGNLDIGPRPIFLAPMEDVTDLSFRVICRRLGADVVMTEFVNSEGLIRSAQKTHRKMTFWEEERPLGIQIYGGEESSMASAATIAESLKPDFIDINCGCWVRNVVGCGAGASLLRDLPKMERIASAVFKSVTLPVTVKTRLGWDVESVRIVDVAKMLEQCGISALTIHCRTRAQGHSGEPDYSWIAKVKGCVRIPIVVNGGIDSPQKAKEVFDSTGCDGIMIARAAIGNPWLFSRAKRFLIDNVEVEEPSIEERIATIVEHLKIACELKGERRAVLEFRKFYAGYLKGLPFASSVRQKLMEYFELSPVIEQLKLFEDELISMNRQPQHGLMSA